MKILRLTLENYRGAPNGEYSFTHPTTGAPLDAVYVTGPASSGKTSFLEAIVALKESVGAYGTPPDSARLVARGKEKGRIEGTWLLTPEEAARAEVEGPKITTALDLGPDVPPSLAEPGIRAVFEGYGHDPAQGKLEYFPANRRLAPREGAYVPSLVHEASMRPARTPDKYAFLRRAIVDLALSDGMKALEEATARGILLKNDSRDSLAPYRRDLAELLPDIRLAGIEMSGGEPDLVFEKRDGTRLGLGDLSDGEQQAFLFAVTFRRIGLSRSIVLVDQPELCLHADVQLRFARAILRLGTDNQVFFATGSPEITRTAAAHEIMSLGA